MTNLEWLLIVYLCFQALDLFTTLQLLRRGGYERNKLINWLVTKIGPDTFYLAKIVAAFSGLVAYFLGSTTGLGILDIFYLGILANNWKVLGRQK